MAVDADPVRNLLARWDTFLYLDIATRGYHWNGNPLQQQNVVFFPLFPLLMRVGRRGRSAAIRCSPGWLVSLDGIFSRALLLLAMDRRSCWAPMRPPARSGC